MGHEGISLAMHVIGSLSCFGSMSMIIVLLHSDDLRRNNLYKRVIFFIAVCDLFGGLAASLGLLHDKTSLCWFQAIMTNIFPLAGVFWTTVLAYLLHRAITTRKAIVELPVVIYILCWILPVILTFLPLTTSRYGPEEDPGWCFIADKSDSPKWSNTFWIIFSFYVWIWIALLLFCVLYIFILVRLRLIKNELVQQAVQNIVWYPLALILCWIVPTFDDIAISLNKDARDEEGVLYHASLIMPVWQGTLNTIIFFSTNEHARDLLWKGMHCLCSCCADQQFSRESESDSVIVTTTISTVFRHTGQSSYDESSGASCLDEDSRGSRQTHVRSDDIEFSSVTSISGK
jgi:hypothetical protein